MMAQGAWSDGPEPFFFLGHASFMVSPFLPSRGPPVLFSGLLFFWLHPLLSSRDFDNDDPLAISLQIHAVFFNKMWIVLLMCLNMLKIIWSRETSKQKFEQKVLEEYQIIALCFSDLFGKPNREVCMCFIERWSMLKTKLHQKTAKENMSRRYWKYQIIILCFHILFKNQTGKACKLIC